jgi:hypothetical protein
MANHPFQPLRIARRVAANVVVEIGKRIYTACDEPIGPMIERLVGICAGIFSGRAVKSHVDERRCDHVWRL